jgi:DNA-binding NarL/FixJ family response regulator/signal transduction histidine kinase
VSASRRRGGRPAGRDWISRRIGLASRFDLSRIDLARVDFVIAVALMVDLMLEAALGRDLPDRLATAIFAIPFAAPVAVRCRWPAAAVIACTATGLLQDAFDGQLFNLPSSSAVIPLMLCSYGAGAWLARRRSFAAIGGAAGLLIADQLIESYVTGVSGGGFSGFATLMLLFLVPWALGRLVYERTRRADAFAALAAQAAAERAERERAAVTQERLMIGRELQDIIAHSVSVMVVQAGGARRLLGTEPDRARESILNVEQIGRDALAEMRRLLGLLRKDDDPRALTPQPGLDQLPELASSLGDAGLVCGLHVEGDPIALTPGIDLVGYRVIETALETAAASRCRQANATVRYEPRQLELEIRGEVPLPGVGDSMRTVTACRAVRRQARRPTRRARRVHRPMPTAARGDAEHVSTSILIADDQALVRAGFRMILEAEPDFRVLAEAKDGVDAVEAARRCRPDAVLMDIRMPRMDGLEATRRIIAAGTAGRPRVLMLTTFDLDEYVYDALSAGASGFLLKDAPPEQLVAGIRVIAEGESLLAPTVTRRLIETFLRERTPAPEPPPALAELTHRELEVLGLIARGLSNSEIAHELVVSDATVKTHVARVLSKLGLRDRVQAVVLAYETGIARPRSTHARES